VVPHGVASYDVGEFFRAAEMRDFLDSVTCMANAIAHDGTHPGKWIQFCQRVFAEEGMTYRIDDSAEAHYVIDVGLPGNSSKRDCSFVAATFRRRGIGDQQGSC
jgi:hypothetical protein